MGQQHCYPRDEERDYCILYSSSLNIIETNRKLLNARVEPFHRFLLNLVPLTPLRTAWRKRAFGVILVPHLSTERPNLVQSEFESKFLVLLYCTLTHIRRQSNLGCGILEIPV